MKITISATLTEEETYILSNTKWYQEQILSIVDWEYVNNPNTQTREDFLRQVYEWILSADATNIFTEYRSAQLKEEQRLLQEAVREWVIASITSTVE